MSSSRSERESFSPELAARLAGSLLETCGGGPVLVLGSPALLRALLARGVDARGDAADDEGCAGLAPDRVTAGSLTQIAHAEESFDTLAAIDVLDGLDEGALAAALGELRRVTRRYLLATVHAEPQGGGGAGREAWERRCFAAGYRRHPLSLELAPYPARETEQGHIRLLLEKLPARVMSDWPLARLVAQRMPHMDMLRDSGRRADAHLARYDLARRLVRPGDVVLDVACGLGAGGAVLAAGSPAARVIGVDESEHAIAYARDAYAPPGGVVEFRRGQACALDFLDDASVDLAVSFGTLEHAREPERLLAELQRVLRPAGRVIVSASTGGADGPRAEPSLNHHFAYDWCKLRAEVAAHFRLERAWAQTAGAAPEHAEAPRELVEVALEPPPERAAEWWLACAMKDPVGADPAGYRETSFPDPAPPDDVHVTAFGRDYDDPWLVKGMVSIGMRSENPLELRRMAGAVLANGRKGSADVGAALCVLAYDRLARPLERSADLPALDELLERIARYHEQADDTPHAWRWRISNQFASALLLRASGRRAQAFDAFVSCAGMDCRRFAPILATKTVDAGFQAGLMAACDGDRERARELWTAVIRTAQQALAGHWRSFLGDLERPIPFGLPEAAQVLDLAGRAAYGLETLARWDVRPGWSFQHAHSGQERNRELYVRAIAYHAEQAAGARAELAAADERQRAQEAEHARRVVRLEGDLQRSQQMAEQHAADLARVYASRGWRWLSLLYRLRDRALPRGSFRRASLRRLSGRAPKDAPRSAAPPRTLRSFVPAPLKPFLRGARDQVRELRAGATHKRTERDWEREHPPFPADGRRVVALAVDSWDKGGVEEVLLSLARNLRRDERLRVVVIVTKGTELGHLGAVARADGIQVVLLGEDRAFLRWLIGRLGIALVNLHYTVFGFEEYQRAGVPLVYTVHNTYIWADAAFVAERRAAYAGIDRFLTVSRAVRDFFVHRFEVDAARVQVVPNGLDLDFVATAESVARAELGLAPDDVVFLNVASFNVNKFHALMIAAMQRVVRELPNAKLLCVGNTHEKRCRDYAEAEIARRGLARHVQVLDFVPKGRVMGLMRLADCFLLPSLIEGWSIAVMEAMHSELPMILSDVGSARDVIEDEDIGIIVRNPFADIRELTTAEVVRRYSDHRHLENLDELVAAMLRVGRDVEGWARRGRAARVKIETHYSAAHMARAYADCFAELLARKPLA